jgi:hypothetical protein
MTDPVSVLLKYGFLIVLYLFLMWVARSAMKDLRRARTTAPPTAGGIAAPTPNDATGYHRAVPLEALDPRLVVERAPGHTPGMEYEVGEGAILGRGDQAEIRLDDPFASSKHARLTHQGGVVVLEDLGSTNGTYLNEELLGGPAPLHPGDRVRIGDSEFTYMEG